MFAEVSIVVAILSAASGLTFNTPKNVVAGSVSSVSWTANSSDPIFSLILIVEPERLRQIPGINEFTLATNLDPLTASPLAVEWPNIATLPSILRAVNISNIDNIYAQSDQFSGTVSVASSITPTSSPTTFTSSPTAPTFSSITTTSSLTPTSNSTTLARASSLSPGSSTQTSNQSRGTSTSSTTSLAISGSTSISPTAIDSGAKNNVVGAIVGGVVGGVVGLVLVGLFTFLSIRRRSHGFGQEGFERWTFKHPEDEIRVNPTSDGSVPLRQDVVAQVEQRVNSPLLRGAFFSPPTPNPSFDPAVPSLDSENPHHSPRSAESLLSTYDMHDTPDPGSPSTARATRGGARYKVASEADKIPNQKTVGPQQAPPITETCHDVEQPLDVSGSRRNTITSLQAPGQPQELNNNQGHNLTMEEDVVLLELQLQIASRLAEIHSSRHPRTPPPEYAS